MFECQRAYEKQLYLNNFAWRKCLRAVDTECVEQAIGKKISGSACLVVLVSYSGLAAKTRDLTEEIETRQLGPWAASADPLAKYGLQSP